MVRPRPGAAFTISYEDFFANGCGGLGARVFLFAGAAAYHFRRYGIRGFAIAFGAQCKAAAGRE